MDRLASLGIPIRYSFVDVSVLSERRLTNSAYAHTRNSLAPIVEKILATQSSVLVIICRLLVHVALGLRGLETDPANDSLRPSDFLR